MQIDKSKGLEYIGHMEEKVKYMGREISSLRDKDAMMRAQLEEENAWLRGQLQERERESISIHGQSIPRGNPVQDAS